MTQEAEMAAKWKMFEDYKAVRGRLAVLEREASTLGLRLSDIASVLTGSPSRIRIISDKVIGVPSGSTSGPSWQEVDVSILNGSEIIGLLSEIATVSKQKIELSAKLRDVGMSLD